MESTDELFRHSPRRRRRRRRHLNYQCERGGNDSLPHLSTTDTKTMKHCITVTALCLLANANAFLITQTTPPISSTASSSSSSRLLAKNKGRQIGFRPIPTGPPPQDITIPADITMAELMSVMGEGRLKKVARKNRRKRNQNIREGKVELNANGEWVAVVKK